MLQKSSGSARERWTKALIPAAGIIALYVMFFQLNYRRTLSDLRQQLASAQQRAISEAELFRFSHDRMAASQEQEELEQVLTTTQRQIDESLTIFSGLTTTERMTRVGQVCRELSISILGQKATTRPSLSSLREESLQRLRKLVPSDALHFEELELVGRYADLEKLLRRLPLEVEGVIPLGIELVEEQKSSPTVGGQRRWRVYLLV